MSSIVFTEHAIDRFIQRHAPEMDRTSARAFLESAAENAVRLKAKTINGQRQWQLASEGIVLVTKPDGGEEVCVTVLPDRPSGGPSEDERRLIAEYAERNRERPPVHVPPRRAMSPTPAPAGEPPVIHLVTAKAVRSLLALSAHENSRAREREKTERHRINSERNGELARAALRLALRFVLEHAELAPAAARGVVERVAAMNPGFLGQEFLDHGRAAG